MRNFQTEHRILLSVVQTYPFCYFIYLYVHKVEILIEVLIFEDSFSDHLKIDSKLKVLKSPQV